MSGAETLSARAKKYMYSLPGKRGIDIPEDRYDRIFQIANGITQTLWGRPPTPHQMQHLHDNGSDSPQAIHEAYSALPHPHADGLSVGEFNSWKKAYKTYQQHQPKR